MKTFWISWWHVHGAPEFELDSPWWISGHRGDELEECSIVAAVKATDEAHAKQLIASSYDEGGKPGEWRFCDELHPEQPVFSDRFKRAAWMVWEDEAAK